MSDPFEDYDDEEEVVDLNPANKAPSNRLERFKGEKDRVYRVALMYFHSLEASIVLAAKAKAKEIGEELDKAAVKAKIKAALVKRAEELDIPVEKLEPWQKLDLSEAKFRKVMTQFGGKIPGVGLVVSRKGKDGPEADKAWDKLDDPTFYHYTIILKYPTNRKGELDVKAILRDGEILPWRFAGGVFNRLVDVNESLKEVGDGLSLANQDLKLTCKNAQFQNFDIDFAGKAAWTRNDKIRDTFLPQAYALYERMVSSDAREMSSADLREKINLAGGGGGSGGDSGEDVDDTEMDDLLGNI